MKKGFTIVELIIVIAILIILAGAALSGAGGIIRSLRFSNAFNKVILMVQQARSLAVTGKNSAMKAYEVQFNFSSPFSAVLQSIQQNDVAQEMERFTLDAQTNLSLTRPSDCDPPVRIRFLNGRAETQLTCGDGVPPTQAIQLTIGLQESAAGAGAGAAPALVRSKSFSIHRASGIPQIN